LSLAKTFRDENFTRPEGRLHACPDWGIALPRVILRID
jgi:hypothetical protein